MTKKTSEKAAPATNELGAIPIKYDIPESIVTRWASNMTIQFIEHEFKISFFELKPQIHFSGPPPTEANAVCVASVIISAERLPKFVSVLNETMAKYYVAKKES